MPLPIAPTRALAFALLALSVPAPLAAQDVMIGTRWSVHQQDRDSGVAWLFLHQGQLRRITRADSTGAGTWHWKADSLEITLAGRDNYVGMLVGQRLAGTRDQGAPGEGWWYADQVGGPSVTPEGLIDTAAVADTTAPTATAVPPFRRRRAMLRRRPDATTGERGFRFVGAWSGGLTLGLQFAMDGAVGYGWSRSDGSVVRGRGRWQRVQGAVVVRIKDVAGSDVVLRGTVSQRAFIGQATLADGSTTPVVLRRGSAGDDGPAHGDPAPR